MSTGDESAVAAESAANPSSGQIDPSALMRSREYRRLLVAAAVIGLVVSCLSGCFSRSRTCCSIGSTWICPKVSVSMRCRGGGRYPCCLVAGLLIAFAVVRLPGHGGHEPSDGLTTGTLTTPAELPGVAIAALATLGLGLVLGPEAPLMALAGGVAVFLIRLSRSQVPGQAIQVLGPRPASQHCPRCSVRRHRSGDRPGGRRAGRRDHDCGDAAWPDRRRRRFSGVRGPRFATGPSTESYAMPPLHLPSLRGTDHRRLLVDDPVRAGGGDGRVDVFGSRGSTNASSLSGRSFFSPWPRSSWGRWRSLEQASGGSFPRRLFSGEHAMADVFEQAEGVSMGVLALLSAASRGVGIFMGAAAAARRSWRSSSPGRGVMASHIRNLANAPAIAVLVGGAVVQAQTSVGVDRAGAADDPGRRRSDSLIIVGVVVAHIATLGLSSRARRGAQTRRPNR